MRLILRELFSEAPYACAIYESFRKTNCSTCFSANAAVPVPCKGGCDKLRYCSEKCRDADELYHQHECMAYKKVAKIGSFVRLLARILTRRLIDGGVVHLAENFPENIPDRSLSDLMSHRREIGGSSDRADGMKDAWKEFSNAFAGTPIMDTYENVARVYCVALINCFSVAGSPNMKKGHSASCGLGFYLNTSRFNHSCRPDLFVNFHGARIVLEYTSQETDEKSIADERLWWSSSAQKFNRLTINYGYSSSFTWDSFFPLRSQRRASLAYGYYFNCQCVLCSDDREANLEEHAAALECAQCAQPCLWKKMTYPPLMCCLSPVDSKYTCQKSCKCTWNETDIDDAKTYTRSLNPDSELKALEAEFRKAMEPRINKTEAVDIISLCEPVLMKARYYWHRSGNLRMAQLNERLFVAYGTLVIAAWKAGQPIDHHVLKMALQTGEGVIKYCDTHRLNASYTSVVAAYAYRVGRLCSISARMDSVVQRSKDATMWYEYAASIWEMQGENCAGIIAELRKLSSEEAQKLPSIAEETRRAASSKAAE